MKKLLLLFLVSSFLTCQAQIPSGYYDSTQNLDGYPLKTALSKIITNGHTPQTYGDLWDAYYTSDVDNYYENDGTVLDIYSENPNGADSYEYTLGNDQCGNYTAESSCYNREHLFPKSWFDDEAPMITDIQHIYPTDGYVNGQRGNYPFGEVGTATYTSDNGSKKGNNVYPFPGAYTGTVFEPIDEFKGDIARVYFYMATRYENEIAGWEHNTAESEHVLNGTSTQVFDTWFLDMLLAWNDADPVSQKEIDRNNAAYDFQGNRNPYIDHPEYVHMIWNVVEDEDNEAPTAPTNLSASNLTGNSVELNWTAATDNIGVLTYDIEQDGTIIASSEDTHFTVEGLSGSTEYSFVVYARDAYANTSPASNTVTVTTAEGPAYLFNENFDECPTQTFDQVSELSAIDWECTQQFGENNSPAIQMNAYSNGNQVPSIDWLITSQAINFDDYTDEKVSFFTAATFGNTELQFLYSSDYDGNGNPSDFTWQPVPNVNILLHPDGGSSIVENMFEDIDISSITGTVYFAFKYDTSNGEEATRWTVDSFVMTGQSALSTQYFTPSSFQIYPNPAIGGVVNFESQYAGSYAFSIYDIHGKLVHKGQIRQSHQTVDISELSPGLYLVHIKAKGATLNQKLIVQ